MQMDHWKSWQAGLTSYSLALLSKDGVLIEDRILLLQQWH